MAKLSPILPRTWPPTGEPCDSVPRLIAVPLPTSVELARVDSPFARLRGPLSDTADTAAHAARGTPAEVVCRAKEASRMMEQQQHRCSTRWRNRLPEACRARDARLRGSTAVVSVLGRSPARRNHARHAFCVDTTQAGDMLHVQARITHIERRSAFGFAWLYARSPHRREHTSTARPLARFFQACRTRVACSAVISVIGARQRPARQCSCVLRRMTRTIDALSHGTAGRVSLEHREALWLRRLPLDLGPSREHRLQGSPRRSNILLPGDRVFDAETRRHG